MNISGKSGSSPPDRTPPPSRLLLRNLVRLYFTNFELEIILLGQKGSRQEHSDMAAYGIVNIYAKSAFCPNYIRLIMTETET